MRRAGERWGRPSNTPSNTVPATPDLRRRDSDVSSIQSSVARGRPPFPTTTLSNAVMLRSINSFLSSNSANVTLKGPYPSNRDINIAVFFLLSQCQYRVNCRSDRVLEEEFAPILKELDCPFKLSKSVLKTPGTPHTWPTFLAGLYWFLQIVCVNDFFSSTMNKPFGEGNDLIQFVTESYSRFIDGDDDGVEKLDDERLRVLQADLEQSIASLKEEEDLAVDLELKLEALRSETRPKEALEKEKALLSRDEEKFKDVLILQAEKIPSMEDEIAALKKELESEEAEIQKFSEENTVLSETVHKQALNVWDYERMHKAIQAVEREIVEIQMGRNAHEDKQLELDASIRRKFKELVACSEHCNDAIKKLKLGNDFRYIPNAEGSTPSMVVGIDYKSMLKPQLKAVAENAKKLYVDKMEEKISVEKQLQENATLLKVKREELMSIQRQNEQENSTLIDLKREIKENDSLYDSEARKIKAEVNERVVQLEIAEKDADLFLKNTEQKLKDTVIKTNKELDKCSQEVLALVDSISKSKEQIQSVISGVTAKLVDTAKYVAEAHKPSSLPPPKKNGGKKRCRQNPLIE